MLNLEPRALLHGAGQPDPLDALPAADLNAPVNNAVPSGALSPLSSVPQLSSYNAPVKIYLDFIGAAAQRWGSYNATTTPAYDTDGDPTTFSATELAQIKEIHARVAEKYSPFNVDVTTVDPGDYPYGEVVRVVVGGDGAWAGGTFGGYGYVNGFQGVTSNTAWVFAKNLGQGLPKYVAEAAAHEAGHNFGLYHQSAYSATGTKLDEYAGGRDKLNPNATDPIMGFSYYATRGTWWDGRNSESYFSLQHDLSVIGDNSFGFRADDAGNDRAGATVLAILGDGRSLSAAGVIEQTTDADVYRFHSAGGAVNLNVDVAALGPMLDLKATLTDADGNLIDVEDTGGLGERVAAIVPEGDYYLTVASHGGYGDVGSYTITGQAVPEPVAAPLLVVAGGAWLARRRKRQGRWSTVEIRR
jgi:hypothetical protein